MIINLTDVLTAEGKTEKRQTVFEPSTVTYSGASYAVAEKTPVFLTMTNTGKGRAQITGTVRLTVTLRCDRCLRDVPYSFPLEFTVQAVAPEVGGAVSEEEEILTGYEIDIDDLVYNEVLIHWPMKVLCKPDCRGICSVCGKDLNEGACECDTFVPDPRLAAIKDIFNAGKEV